MIKKLSQKLRGTTLLDAVLALTMFGIFAGFIVSILLVGQDSVLVSGKRQEAAMLAYEAAAAIENIIKDDFEGMVDGSYGLSTSSNQYNLVADTIENIGIFNRTIDIAVIDYVSRAVVVTVSWTQNLQRSGSIVMAYNIYNWGLGRIEHDNKIDLDSGLRNSLKVNDFSTSTAEIVLARAADWSRNILYRTYNLPGTAIGRDTGIYRYYLYVMTDVNASGPELTRLDINNLGVGEISVDKTWDFGRSLYKGYFDNSLTKAYFASTDPHEISIMDFTTNASSSINVAGTIAANDVWVNGSKIFMVKANDASNPELEIYNTSGTRIGSREIGANANMVIADSQYAYIVTASTTGELTIVDHTACSGTTPFSCPITRAYDMTGTSAGTALAHGTSTDWYIGRADGGLYGLTITSPASISQFYNSATILTQIDDLDYNYAEQLLTVASYRSTASELTFVDMTSGTMYTRDLTGSARVYGAKKYGTMVYAATAETANELQTVRALGKNWDDPYYMGSYNAAGTANATRTFVDGDYAYMGTKNNTGGNEFYILDVSTPGSPVYVSSLEFGVDVNDIWVSGNYAYIATGKDTQELIVLDISNKSAPTWSGTLDLATTADGLAIDGDAARNILFIGTQNNTTGVGFDFYVINLNNGKTTSTMLMWEGFDAGGYVNDMDYDIINKVVYLATGNLTREMQVVDVYNPAIAVGVDGYDTNNSAAYAIDYDPITENSYLTLANGGTNQDFYMFQSQGAQRLAPDWSVLQFVAMNGDPVPDGFSLKVDNTGYAYLGTILGSGAVKEFFIMDITNINTPSTTASYEVGGKVWDMYINGDYAYLATDNATKEVQVINMTNRRAPVESTYYNFTGSLTARGIDRVGTTTYVAFTNGSLYAMDSSATNTLSIRGSVATGYTLTKLSAGPKYVVTATDTSNISLATINVENWSSMSVVGTYQGNSNCYSIFYEEAKNRAFLGCDDNGANPDFHVVDMTNPANPYFLSSTNTGASNNDVYVWGSNAYLATSNAAMSVKIWNVTTSTSPTYVGYFDAYGSTYSVFFDGAQVFLASDYDTGELQISANGWKGVAFLTMYKSLDLNSDNYGVYGDDDYAFVATGSTTEGLSVVDVSTTIVPQQIAAYNTSTSSGATMDSRGYLYMSTSDDAKELQIFAPSPEVKGFVDVGWFTSAPYDSGVSNARWKYVSWTSSSTPAITFQLRTSPANASSSWGEWLGPTGTNDSYVTGTTPNLINATQRDRSNDRWFQYRAILNTTDFSVSPELYSITVYYD